MLKTENFHSSGTASLPQISLDIPNGKNRMMIITIAAERKHNGNIGNNHILSDYNTSGNKWLDVKVGNTNAVGAFWNAAYSNNTNSTTVIPSQASFTN